MIGIYCITNKINNKKYIGQSTNIERRKKAYFNYNDFPNDHLKNAFNKYGKENFEFKIIKCCKEKYLDRFEKLYIRINDTTNREKGYNKETGGNLNKHLSDEIRKKVSENMPDHSGENNPFYGQKHTLESRKQMSEVHIGQTHSDETKKKISENNAKYWEGKTRPEETRKKISEKNKGKNNPRWKNFPRIVKAGVNNGNQRYKLVYEGEILAYSISKEKLCDIWYDKNPDIKLIDETIGD